MSTNITRQVQITNPKTGSVLLVTWTGTECITVQNGKPGPVFDLDQAQSVVEKAQTAGMTVVEVI